MVSSLRYVLAVVAGMTASAPAFAEEPPTGSTPKCETIFDHVDKPLICPAPNSPQEFCRLFKAAIDEAEAKSKDDSLTPLKRGAEEVTANNLRSALKSFGCTEDPPLPEPSPIRQATQHLTPATPK